MKIRVILFLLLSCSLALSQGKKTTAPAHWAGTYKLDIAKSQIQPPVPKEETVTVDAADKNSVKYTIASTDAEGNAHTIAYDGKPGTPSPVMMDGKEASKLTYHMVGPRHFTGQEHFTDGSTGSVNAYLSHDNKIITVHVHSKTAKGATSQTFVYMRQ